MHACPCNGEVILNLHWDEITCKSIVFVSASEYEADTRNGYQCSNLGGAKYTIHNVSPYDGGIKVWLEINWDSPLPVRTDFLVYNE
jgi:hypothetical protein